jgi:hypothetical protein
MKLNEVMNHLNTIDENDAIITQWNNHISADINDFDGFDENWDEIANDYNEEVIDNMRQWLANNCNEVQKGFYDKYFFDDGFVRVGYTSYDI